MTTDTIDSFKGEYLFLSNFYPCNIVYEGVIYKSVEHAYQAAKTVDRAERATIALTLHASGAKKAGKYVTMRPDWELIKVDVMRSLVKQKFRHQNLYELLQATKGKSLVEGNTWGDTFWGICRGKGENKLGVMLMWIRDHG